MPPVATQIIDILFDVACDRRSGVSIYHKRFRTAESIRNPDPTDSDSEISDSENDR